MPRIHVVSVRQQRVLDLQQPVETPRQRSVIRKSARDDKLFRQKAERIARDQGIPYDRAAAILAAAYERSSEAARRKKSLGNGEQ